jgi:YbbR domain-containing protein
VAEICEDQAERPGGTQQLCYESSPRRIHVSGSEAEVEAAMGVVWVLSRKSQVESSCKGKFEIEVVGNNGVDANKLSEETVLEVDSESGGGKDCGIVGE